MSKYDFALYLAKKKRLAKKNIVSYKSILVNIKTIVHGYEYFKI